MDIVKSVDAPLKKTNYKTLIHDFFKTNESTKFFVITVYSIIILLTSFLFNSPSEIVKGSISIISHYSILISDYMVIGNPGAAFFNSGMLMLISIVIVKLNKINMNGTIIAAIFTVGGFAFFGKNIFNIWPIILGVYIFSKVKKEKFGSFILIALFGTSLAPLVSKISFGFGLNVPFGITVGILLGIVSGFLLPSLAKHMVKFHMGFNIYNIGFTAGLLGTLFMALFRSFGLRDKPTMILAEGYTLPLAIYFSAIFVSMLIIGYLLNNRSFSGFRNILKRSGRLVTDFVAMDGFGLSLVNMGILGIVSVIYVIFAGGEMNGPIIGGILTVVGFAAFGKHILNVLPILIGVYLASLIQVWEMNSTICIIAALFGTTLAPIAGEFGWKAGIAAGFLHMAVVVNVAYLHGGISLYNNGFAGGFVAALLVPIIYALRKEDKSEAY